MAEKDFYEESKMHGLVKVAYHYKYLGKDKP
jgi:hypothetical protein